MGARNRDAAVAASSFIVTHIAVATAQLLIVCAATKRRYRRCCPLLWRCGLLPSRRCAAAVVAMRSVFPGAAAPARAWDLRNVETGVVKPTENPLTSLITAALSPSRRARLTIFRAYEVHNFFTAWVVRSADRQGTAPRLAWPPNLRPLSSFRDSPRQTRNLFF